jgi:A/G-specific adenine glycosylase
LNVERLLKIEVTQKRARAFRRSLFRWYRNHGRDLPWRRTRDPYAILVSEFMLQQTQVTTVLPYYKEWLRRFPNFAALAGAAETDVLHAWQGLGYYVRARNLYLTAKIVVDRHRGRFPSDVTEIQKLPGVGRYTANAIATFAFDQSAPIVEANSARVLARLFDLRIPIDSSAGRTQLWDHAASLVPETNPGMFNSALLDLGALVCLPRNPKCGICPVKNFCRAKSPASLPVKRPRPPTKRLTEKHALILRQNKILLQSASHRWRGMWILPPLNGDSDGTRAIYNARFPFTNHQITLKIFAARRRKIDNQRERWFSGRDLDSIPIPSPHRRAIEQLIANA